MVDGLGVKTGDVSVPLYLEIGSDTRCLPRQDFIDFIRVGVRQCVEANCCTEDCAVNGRVDFPVFLRSLERDLEVNGLRPLRLRRCPEVEPDLAYLAL